MNFQCAVVLLYHRIDEVTGVDPWRLTVTPTNFDEQLAVLREMFTPLSLEEFTRGFSDKKLPSRAVLVTFDDGYKDNLEKALPLLKKHNIPAAIFITTLFVNSKCEPWWHQLERIVLRPGSLPEMLHLGIGKSAFRFHLGNSADFNQKEYDSLKDWNAWDEFDYHGRHTLYKQLYNWMRPLPDVQQLKILRELSELSKTESLKNNPGIFLSTGDLTELVREKIIDFGAHTVTHPVLSVLPESLQREEILNGKLRLEEMVGRTVNSFAYPYGGEDTFTGNTVSIVRNAGFHFAFTAIPKCISEDDEPYRIPRFYVKDWNGDELLKHLHPLV